VGAFHLCPKPFFVFRECRNRLAFLDADLSLCELRPLGSFNLLCYLLVSLLG
jgi:hypothetical protein